MARKNNLLGLSVALYVGCSGAGGAAPNRQPPARAPATAAATASGVAEAAPLASSIRVGDPTKPLSSFAPFTGEISGGEWLGVWRGRVLVSDLASGVVAAPLDGSSPHPLFRHNNGSGRLLGDSLLRRAGDHGELALEDLATGKELFRIAPPPEPALALTPWMAGRHLVLQYKTNSGFFVRIVAMDGKTSFEKKLEGRNAWVVGDKVLLFPDNESSSPKGYELEALDTSGRSAWKTWVAPMRRGDARRYQRGAAELVLYDLEDKVISIVDASSGKRTELPIDDGHDASGATRTVQAVDERSVLVTVFVPNRANPEKPSRVLELVDRATGKKLWELPIGTFQEIALTSDAIVFTDHDDKQVYNKDGLGRLVVVDRTDGNIAWSTSFAALSGKSSSLTAISDESTQRLSAIVVRASGQKPRAFIRGG